MRPSGVRKRILREHEELRGRLDTLDALAERLDTEGEAAIPDALAESRAFYDVLIDHIDLEDEILAPALREADAWGDVRAEKLIGHHREQRKELEALAGADAKSSSAELASRLRRIIADVREDMVHEEKEILHRNLLRDDVVGIDVEGG